jgi:hypothetical protein
MDQVDMKVQHIEILGALPDLLEHHDMIGQSILDPGIEPQSRLGTGDQAGRRLRIAAGEKGHVVTLPHQLFRQKRYDSLGAAVQARWHAFIQRGNLCDLKQ